MPDRVEFAPDLFHGTAKDYDRFRLPYPPALVDHLLSLVEPAGNGWLLDLGCGNGQLTFALLDRFARVWAVDHEADMIEVVAAKAAAGRGNVEPIVSRAEDLGAPERAFELVAIGNAFHRLDRERVAGRLVRWLIPAGHVALVWSGSPWSGGRDWHATLRELIDRWRVRLAAESRVPRGWDEVRRRRPDRAVLTSAGFDVLGSYRFPTAHDWTVESLTGLLHSTSMLPRSVLGEQLPAFEREVAEALAPCLTGGVLPDTIDFAYELARAPAAG